MPSTTRVFAAKVTTGLSDTYEADGFAAIRVQVWSTEGSTATVLIQQRSRDDNAPWYTSATITNPSATGEYWVLPPSGDLRINLSAYTDGDIYANLERFTVRGTA